MPGGSISIGPLEGLGEVALAFNATKILASLRWQQGEPLDAVLVRLDEAVGQSMSSGQQVNDLGVQFSMDRPSSVSQQKQKRR